MMGWPARDSFGRIAADGFDRSGAEADYRWTGESFCRPGRFLAIDSRADLLRTLVRSAILDKLSIIMLRQNAKRGRGRAWAGHSRYLGAASPPRNPVDHPMGWAGQGQKPRVVAALASNPVNRAVGGQACKGPASPRPGRRKYSDSLNFWSEGKN